MAIFPNPQSLTPVGLPSLVGAPSVSVVKQQTNALTTIAPPAQFPVNDDELTQLQPMALKYNVSDNGVSFPGLVFDEAQDKALIPHMYPHVDGARVENMGAHQQIYRIRAILTNNIFPGTKELWKQGDLFPNVFNQLLLALADNNPKIFVHPIKGNVNVQVKSWNYQLMAKGPRDGAIVEFILWETILGDLATITSQPSPGAASTIAAANLDNAIGSTNTAFNPPGLSLSQFFGKLNSLVRSAIAIPNQTIDALNMDLLGVTSGVTGITSAILSAPAYTLNSILQTINANTNLVIGTTNVNSINASGVPIAQSVFYDESTWNAVQAMVSLNYNQSSSASQLLDKADASLQAMQQHYINQNTVEVAPVIEALKQYQYQIQQTKTQLVQTGNSNQQYVSIQQYVTKSAMTWLQLSELLNNQISDLVSLNQDLMKKIWVPTNTSINYYQQ